MRTLQLILCGVFSAFGISCNEADDSAAESPVADDHRWFLDSDSSRMLRIRNGGETIEALPLREFFRPAVGEKSRPWLWGKEGYAVGRCCNNLLAVGGSFSWSLYLGTGDSERWLTSCATLVRLSGGYAREFVELFTIGTSPAPSTGGRLITLNPSHGEGPCTFLQIGGYEQGRQPRAPRIVKVRANQATIEYSIPEILSTAIEPTHATIAVPSLLQARGSSLDDSASSSDALSLDLTLSEERTPRGEREDLLMVPESYEHR